MDSNKWSRTAILEKKSPLLFYRAFSSTNVGHIVKSKGVPYVFAKKAGFCVLTRVR